MPTPGRHQLRVRNRDGQSVYPLAQFDGARAAAGLAISSTRSAAQ
jgi:hypothetical protein